ncbi:integral membrane sensor signal transduction histidine kinase [Rhodothermus marinus SG0.5JP17-172]|uniref:sensor histidine kinase n=1 Tax=Rhodothermus marinus TaxID=29549 RepID=UPI000223DA2B|nr:sensor histidine kinase [Rhodothermus marinus]AEN73540.1 integral membrane sensor signal transduction histidine kinase [Rhodothermus marinus SG0.5JP17-172]
MPPSPILLLLILLPSGDTAQPAVLRLDHAGIVSITEPYAALLVDPTDTLTLAQVLQSDAWRSPARLTPDLPPGTYWLRLKLVAAPGRSHWLVEIPADQVTGYVLVDGRLPPRDTLRTGFLVPPRMRDIATFRPPYLSLHLSPGVPHHLYLRVRHNFVSYVSPGVPVPIRLHPIDEALAAERSYRVVQGLLAGLLLAMALYNLFLFLVVRERSYLYYVMLTALLALFWLSAAGYLADLFWPIDRAYPHAIDFYLLLGAGLGYLCFTVSFLETSRYAPIYHRLLHLLMALLALPALLGLFGYWVMAEQAAATAALMAALLSFGAAWQAHRRAHPLARYYLLAALPFVLGLVVYVTAWWGLLPVVPLTRYSAQFGSAAEALLLSLALGARIRLLTRERQQALLDRTRAEAAERHLQEINALKTHLLGATAHDLRNPLSSVQGLIQTVREELPPDSPHRELLELAEAASQRMLGTIEQLITASALESGRVTFRRIRVDLVELVAETVRFHQDRATRKQQQLSFQAPSAGSCVVETDPEQLRRALTNLLTNALKFTPSGKRIEVQLARHADAVRLSVRDEGPGLTEADRVRLFGYFQRLSAQPTDNEPSSGLGLAITKQIVERLGGQIEVDSTPGRGSTFTIVLPAAHSDATGT